MALYQIQNFHNGLYLRMNASYPQSGTQITGVRSPYDDGCNWSIHNYLNNSGTTDIRCYLSPYFGLNAYRGVSPFLCNVYEIDGNETDADVQIIPIPTIQGGYRIKLAHYDKYLCINSNAAVPEPYWDDGSDGYSKVWFINNVDPDDNVRYLRCPLMNYTRLSQGYTASHRGIDFAAPAGTPIRAAHKGVISYLQTANEGDPSMGNTIFLKHLNYSGNVVGVSMYMHMQAPSTRPCGTVYEKGDIIGYVGSTGNSSGNHLHFGYKSGYVTDGFAAYNQGTWCDPVYLM